MLDNHFVFSWIDRAGRIEEDAAGAVRRAVRDVRPDVIGVSVRNIDDQNMERPAGDVRMNGVNHWRRFFHVVRDGKEDPEMKYAEFEVPKEIDRNLKIMDNAIRHMIVKLDEK